MACWQYEFAIVGKVGVRLLTIAMLKVTGDEQVPVDDGVNR